ncbi:hypothetical protein GCM10009104_18400 [Marinobacterium maritimum]|uniref:Glycosyltransferase n=1 Tax=Marinobacterium maritimum TaxID=500162 RepID=A0ABP3T8X6_9GAMM
MNIFVCPTNKSFMPYVDLYEDVTDKVFLVWDRFGEEKESKNNLIYRDGRKGHRRNIINYVFFAIFVIGFIVKNVNKDDRVIIFTPQLFFFIWPFLVIKGNYALDYRDYHFLTKLIPSFSLRKASFIAISSPAYRTLFPCRSNVVLSHNYKRIIPKQDYGIPVNPYSISCIGAIRDFGPNSEIIKELCNRDEYKLFFHGRGVAEVDLKEFSDDIGAENVYFTGYYDKNEECNLYKSASLINLLRFSDGYNDRVALPNRLYNSAQYKRPILCYHGTLLAEYVERYSLGVCLEKGDDFSSSIKKYFDTFSIVKFESDTERFLADVEREQEEFKVNYSGFFN